MSFYDFRIWQKGTAPRMLKLRLPLSTALEEAMTNLYRTSQPDNNGISSSDDDKSCHLDSGKELFLNQIKCIQCNSVELGHSLRDDECTLEALESPTMPLRTEIIEVVLEEPHTSVLLSPDKEPKKQDVLKLFMAKAKSSFSFLEIEQNTETATLQENIMRKLRTLCELQDIGYCDATLTRLGSIQT